MQDPGLLFFHSKLFADRKADPLTFTKADFASVLPQEYLDKNILLGVVYECVEDNMLRFAGSVGSADALSDEYVPMRINISSTGSMSISRDNRLDSTENEQEEDDGV